MDIEYKQLNQEADELLAQCFRWEAAYTKIFSALELAQVRIEYLEAQLRPTQPDEPERDA